MPFELWKSWKPSVRHVHVWGCLAKVRVYNPQEKKLDSRIVSRYFIGYVEKSKEYKFYYLSYTMKIIETHNVRFLENDVISWRNEPTLESLSRMIVFPNSHQDSII